MSNSNGDARDDFLASLAGQALPDDAVSITEEDLAELRAFLEDDNQGLQAPVEQAAPGGDVEGVVNFEDLFASPELHGLGDNGNEIPDLPFDEEDPLGVLEDLEPSLADLPFEEEDSLDSLGDLESFMTTVNDPENPTHFEIGFLFGMARNLAETAHPASGTLTARLNANYRRGEQECEFSALPPRAILGRYLENERNVVNTWNTTLRSLEINLQGPVPDELESFPLRGLVVQAGIPCRMPSPLDTGVPSPALGKRSRDAQEETEVSPIEVNKRPRIGRALQPQPESRIPLPAMTPAVMPAGEPTGSGRRILNPLQHLSGYQAPRYEPSGYEDLGQQSSYPPWAPNGQRRRITTPPAQVANVPPAWGYVSPPPGWRPERPVFQYRSPPPELRRPGNDILGNIPSAGRIPQPPPPVRPRPQAQKRPRDETEDDGVGPAEASASKRVRVPSPLGEDGPTMSLRRRRRDPSDQGGGEAEGQPPAKKPRQKGSYSSRYDQLSNAPSANIPFPATIAGRAANITAVEILTFLPRWLQSVDVVERFFSNGATYGAIANIINRHRTLAGAAQVPAQGPAPAAAQGPAKVYNNYLLHSCQATMRAQGDKSGNGGQDYTRWTMSKHRALATHDPRRLDVSSLRTKAGVTDNLVQKKKRQTGNDASADAINFRDLADNVRQMPQGYDALDLTPCVNHALQNPDQDWFFPTDFETLVEIISPPGTFGTPVQAEHQDSAVFGRWR